MYTLDRREEVTSTNDVCKEMAAKGTEGKYACSAMEQTKGRGRLGRTWVSEKNVGLYMSILERPHFAPEVAPLLSVAAGMAVVHAVKEVAGLKAQLKWPNDVVVNGKKLCGILAEMELEGNHIEYVVVGIGVNLFHKTFPEEIKETATSISLETGMEENSMFREKMEKSIVKWWETYYNQVLQDKSIRGFKEEYLGLLANYKEKVRVLDPAGEYTATCIGVDEDGSLLVKTEDRIEKKVRSGEVSVRGIYGYV
ncbi:MAG: biotin--[acetyl-CoA-carboxylase] ligase [Lachnospiraceae bacterium]|nr:biotin--[acetyl-CoA-carboxylase] ligase [Lachnospiraceae bacterium]